MNSSRQTLATPHLVLGGARSGKSVFAEKTLLNFPPPYVYLATAQVRDEEMRRRVQEHRRRREGFWETLESPYRLVENLLELRSGARPVLVDCLTLWLSNLLLQPEGDPRQAVDRLVDTLKIVDYPLVLVSNEVGTGIVPDNPLARQFRDLAGLTNQSVASVCRSVTLVVAGIPLQLKQEPLPENSSIEKQKSQRGYGG
ncbi:bifunctional adenosylcobinamide kinase/adenosylcobinamide-phosphate guanylyltransferase [Desulfoferrobacter suflitae]|uniref:bifunctional adenosylcobinamide kinase/adenosylcobinamide-phosphate guanylyltransferase n=1 Tax=Desulfoferrobacter suflitae TaxID=2865782 RepID=UPI002164570C|nr:bifunctional adenosylcobinamide kinase/adenosylcobinamide-phosphate guanylyltransferase [Desulfoferrobacter suflitae]MCK8601118.1 bifunctional adenosylcobinamide kinase/adenosylcobinamide-phosphate guanylyltransferase [Desulfoferrobacter suflitae]